MNSPFPSFRARSVAQFVGIAGLHGAPRSVIPPFELDPASGRLFRGPRRVPLSDMQAAILVQLVSNVGDVVSREALIEAAWGTRR